MLFDTVLIILMCSYRCRTNNVVGEEHVPSRQFGWGQIFQIRQPIEQVVSLFLYWQKWFWQWTYDLLFLILGRLWTMSSTHPNTRSTRDTFQWQRRPPCMRSRNLLSIMLFQHTWIRWAHVNWHGLPITSINTIDFMVKKWICNMTEMWIFNIYECLLVVYLGFLRASAGGAARQCGYVFDKEGLLLPVTIFQAGDHFQVGNEVSTLHCEQWKRIYTYHS